MSPAGPTDSVTNPIADNSGPPSLPVDPPNTADETSVAPSGPLVGPDQTAPPPDPAADMAAPPDTPDAVPTPDMVDVMPMAGGGAMEAMVPSMDPVDPMAAIDGSHNS